MKRPSMVRARARALSVGAPAPISEAQAAAALEGMRGKSVRQAAPPKAGVVAASVMRAFVRGESGLTLGELRRRWPEIVGDKLAKLTRPEKLSRADGGVLTIEASSSAAPFVQHQERLILDRCALAGGRIARIAIKQVAASAIGAQTLANVRPLKRSLSAEEERALSAGLALVEDKRLKDALARLGRTLAVRG